MKSFLVIIGCISLLSSCTKKPQVENKPVEQVAIQEEEKILQDKTTPGSKKSETKKIEIEISGQEPKQISEKFKVEDQDAMLFQEEQHKPIMVAVMAPMSGKYDMIGNGIMDGAHIALIELFNKYKIPVKLTAIDIGSGIEEMEFNISKLDDTQFDVIIGLTSNDQREFVKSYIENYQHKPQIMSLIEDDCSISSSDQIQLINSQDKKVYVVLPMSKSESQWKRENIKVMQYSTDDTKMTNDDLMKITQKIEEETRGKEAMVIFTESNWKLQKFMANLDSLKLNDRIGVVLASLSQANVHMEAVNEKRHKFGNIGVISFDNQEYNTFDREFYEVHNKKTLEVSFLSYNVVKQLKNGVFESDKWNLDNITCKPKIKLFEQNYRSW